MRISTSTSLLLGLVVSSSSGAISALAAPIGEVPSAAPALPSLPVAAPTLPIAPPVIPIAPPALPVNAILPVAAPGADESTTPDFDDGNLGERNLAEREGPLHIAGGVPPPVIESKTPLAVSAPSQATAGQIHQRRRPADPTQPPPSPNLPSPWSPEPNTYRRDDDKTPRFYPYPLSSGSPLSPPASPAAGNYPRDDGSHPVYSHGDDSLTGEEAHWVNDGSSAGQRAHGELSERYGYP